MISAGFLVRVTGFEPAVSWSQTGTENFFRTFPMIFHHFRSYSVTLVTSYKPPFPPVPRASVVIHVVKNASRSKEREAFLHLSSVLIQRNTVSYLRCCRPYRRATRNQRGSSGSVQLHQIHRGMPAVGNAHDFQWFSAGRTRSGFPCLTSGAISLLCVKCV